MEPCNNIILTGFMGCGKSTVGKLLAEQSGKLLIDTDEWIAQHQQRTISEIFSSEGEECFREMETSCLRELIAGKESRIISLGGGLPVGGSLKGEPEVVERTRKRGEENRRLLKRLGTVFYLKVSAQEVYQRLRGDTQRPLLQTENPYEKICELLSQRCEWYEKCADVVILADGKTPEEIVAEIRERMQKMKILIVNGPNLNFLGIREKGIYGTQNYEDLLKMISDKSEEMGVLTEVFQSNHEGAIIDRIQDAYFDGTDGIVINPGAYTHYSYAIRDALASVSMPKIEIHISDITQREEFRKNSVTAPVCNEQIYGKGLSGYLEAMEKVANMIRKG